MASLDQLYSQATLRPKPLLLSHAPERYSTIGCPRMAGVALINYRAPPPPPAAPSV